MNFELAKQVWADYLTWKRDTQGIAACPNRHQILVAETVLTNQDLTGLPGATIETMLPYTPAGVVPPTEAEARAQIQALIDHDAGGNPVSARYVPDPDQPSPWH
jgi:hypothetical protein